jgi:hypothetical protein
MKNPKKETLLQKLDKSIQQKKYEKHSREAYDWLKKEAGKLRGGAIRDRFVQEHKTEGRQLRGNPKKANIGDMVFYNYWAKHEKTLPYFDSYPLVILTDIVDDKHFRGISLHYIPPRYRAQLLDQMLAITNNDRFDSTTKFRLTYGLLKSVTGLKMLKHCYKEYLFSNVRSRPVKIQPKYWEIAVFLPMANWQKATASVIWNDVVQKTT